ncbi:hypothetical protein [Hydrogenobaculum acidophilum]
MNKKYFLLSFIALFILEFFLLEGGGTYPFPEAFLPLIFLNIENPYTPLKAFLLGVLMDLSVNTFGIFTFSYTFYTILARFLFSYTIDFEDDYLKLPAFFIFDILVKITNVGILYIKYSYIHIGFISFAVAVLIDCLIFLALNMFNKK